MKRILVTYATLSGSTDEVARTISEEITASGVQVDVIPLRQVKSLAGYDGVVLGGPMIMGWHRDALGFLRQHRKTFQRLPFAIFVMALSLTETGAAPPEGVPLVVDNHLPKPPEKAGRLTFRERYANASNYLRPILAAARPAKPVSVGIFGGRLDYGRLKWWAVLFAMLLIQAPAGDRRNWPAIRAWASSLPAALGVTSPQAELTLAV
jgi:menaquinone-dependent protoporphyrinogen oxidase